LALRKTSIIRWTGSGNLGDLKSAVKSVLRSNGAEGRVWSVGNAVVAEGNDPLGVAALLGNMPGVAWIAAGEIVRSSRQLSSASARIAPRYLRRGDRFRVLAEGTAGAIASDLSGTVTSAILESVRGARASEGEAGVTFRAAFDGTMGAVGVEVRKGPGGVPTGREKAVCIVSGGMHSSVLAWAAALSGYRVRLVHARTNDDALKAVAVLYAELSHRVNPRGLGLEVLHGDSTLQTLARFASKSGVPNFGGFHRGGSEVPALLRGGVLAPLYLLPREGFESAFETLGVKAHESKETWNVKGTGRFVSRKISGATYDVSGVLDALR
jgi:hypothetical protein